MDIDKLSRLRDVIDSGYDPESLGEEQVSLLTEGLAGLLDTDIQVIEAADLSKTELVSKFNTAVLYSNKQAEAQDILKKSKEYMDLEILPECVHHLNESLTCNDVLNRIAQTINTRALLHTLKR